eukprot:COSAG05_NODE_19_length_34900_cov_72.237464_9_plen_197_part_00
MLASGLPAGGVLVRLTTTSTGAAAGVGYPEGGVEAMTGQSTLDLARSEETEDQQYAGSQQPPLQPQAADTASVAAWGALTSLRTNLTDRGHGPAPPASAALFDKIVVQATLDVTAQASHAFASDANERTAVSIHLQLLQDKHLMQLLDRALCGKLEQTDQDFDPSYKPSLFYNIINNEYSNLTVLKSNPAATTSPR